MPQLMMFGAAAEHAERALSAGLLNRRIAGVQHAPVDGAGENLRERSEARTRGKGPTRFG